MTKAIALVSGGLDSLLAAKVVQDQGIDVLGVAFVMNAASTDIEKTTESIKIAAEEAGIPVRVIDISEEFLNIVKNPKHGYGGNVNPCIDCKIYMMKTAKKIMEEVGASFMITGEVLGERPMSQNKGSLEVIKKESTVDDLLLRPLSAKLLEETLPERDGLVDRNKLLSIQGRSRKPQLELARQYGIKKYAAPGASCLLTDPGFSKQVKDLLAHKEFSLENIEFVKKGRYFRIDEKTKLVIGRDQAGNEKIEVFAATSGVLLRLAEKNGPLVLMRGEINEKNIKLAAGLCISHSKCKNSDKEKIEYWNPGSGERTIIAASPLPVEEVERLRV